MAAILPRALVLGCALAATPPDVCLSPGACGSDPAEAGDALSLAQVRAHSLLKGRNAAGVVPAKGTIFSLEVYISEMRSYGNHDLCKRSGDFNFARSASVGDLKTGCLNQTTQGDWFATNGFDDCYSIDVGEDPELEVGFEAYENQDADRCSYGALDACHVKHAHLISASEITKMDEWLPGMLGRDGEAHSLYYYYKLTLFTTTTSTTTTTTTTTVTTTTTTTMPVAVCKVFGDPHIIGFDKGTNFIDVKQRQQLQEERDPLGTTTDDFETGDFWLVKSPLLNIQGRYNKAGGLARYKNSFLRVLAVGGPFLNNNTLIIGNRHAKVFWNDKEILTALPSEYRNTYITARYHDATLVQDKSREAPGIDISLPLGVRMLVNRGKNGVGVEISMPKLQGGQDGQCGNFNGDPNDDTTELVADRVGLSIPVEQILFRRRTAKEQEEAPAAEAKED